MPLGLNTWLLGQIFFWECALYHFKAFCWVLHYIVYNDEARECVGRYPWDYGAGTGDGYSPLPPIVDLLYDSRLCHRL